jgi:hypothetical protein
MVIPDNHTEQRTGGTCDAMVDVLVNRRIWGPKWATFLRGGPTVGPFYCYLLFLKNSVFFKK